MSLNPLFICGLYEIKIFYLILTDSFLSYESVGFVAKLFPRYDPFSKENISFEKNVLKSLVDYCLRENKI